MRTPLLAAVVFGAICCGHLTQAAPAISRYTIVELGTLHSADEESFALDINNLGEVVGFAAASTASEFDGERPFVFRNGLMQELPIGTNSAHAIGINDSGEVIGTYWASRPWAGLQYASFFFSNGTVTDLSAASLLPLFVSGINRHGHSVGTDRTDGQHNGFIYRDGAFEYLNLGLDMELSDINDKGQILGQTFPIIEGEYLARAFVLKDGVMDEIGLLPGADYSYGYAMNNHGTVVGRSGRAREGIFKGFVYIHKRMVEVPPLPNHLYTHLRAINDSSVAVGYSASEYGHSRAVIWEDGKLTDLNELVPSSLGWEIIEGGGINKAGQIAATGKRDGKLRALLLTPMKPGKGLRNSHN